jgi:hypothetical protein
MHLNQDVADLVRGRFVAQANRRVVPDTVAPGKVLDLEVRELRVRDGDDGAIERAHPRRAEAYLLDGTDCPSEATEFPHPHRLVGVECDTADEVFQRLLCCQRHRDPADAEPCQDSDDVDTETVEHGNAGESRDKDLQRLPEHRQQGKQDGFVASQSLGPGDRLKEFHDAQSRPCDRNDQQDLLQDIEYAAHGQGEF